MLRYIEIRSVFEKKNLHVFLSTCVGLDFSKSGKRVVLDLSAFLSTASAGIKGCFALLLSWALCSPRAAESLCPQVL